MLRIGITVCRSGRRSSLSLRDEGVLFLTVQFRVSPGFTCRPTRKINLCVSVDSSCIFLAQVALRFTQAGLLGNSAEGSTGKELLFLGYDSGDFGNVPAVHDDSHGFFLLHGFNGKYGISDKGYVSGAQVSAKVGPRKRST